MLLSHSLLGLEVCEILTPFILSLSLIFTLGISAGPSGRACTDAHAQRLFWIIAMYVISKSTWVHLPLTALFSSCHLLFVQLFRAPEKYCIPVLCQRHPVAGKENWIDQGLTWKGTGWPCSPGDPRRELLILVYGWGATAFQAALFRDSWQVGISILW